MYKDSAMLGTSGYDRIDQDFYPTPSWCVERLLEKMSIPKEITIWEPAAGDGAIVDVLLSKGYNVKATDLVDRGRGYELLDFLKTKSEDVEKEGPCIIMTNPPYGKLAEKFVEHALSMNHVVAVVMLLRNEFDCARKRGDLFTGDDFYKKVVLRQRPRFIRGSTGSPRHHYSWYIWMKGKGGNAKIVYN